MPLEDILRSIREKAERAAKEEIAAAEAKASERLREAEDDARRIAQDILSEAEAKAAAQELVAKSRAESLARQMALKEKQDLISQAFDRAMAELRDMPDEEYRAILLRTAVRECAGGEEVVLGQEDLPRVGQDFASDVNRALREAGKPEISGVVLALGSLGGGLLLRKGGIVANFTFPAALKKIRDDLEIEVAGLLFRES